MSYYEPMYEVALNSTCDNVFNRLVFLWEWYEESNIIEKYWILQAGLTNWEVGFQLWEWEEELEVLNMEHIAFGKTFIFVCEADLYILMLYVSQLVS